MSARAQTILDRLHGLHPRLIDLSLDRIERLLRDLGNPERRMAPAIHVAGTNGKGSTCAFLRSIAEAAGLRVHVYTSPHLVAVNERIRLAGALATDAALEDALAQVERVNAGAPITVFEVLVAVAFLLFARVPGDLCVVEVGLGGRGDATNVLAKPAACAITSISIDHREFLGDTLGAIAAEKAGIAKPDVPLVTGAQDPEALAAIEAGVARVGARLLARGRAWDAILAGDGFRFRDAGGVLDLPRPSLLGLHQIDNAGIAVATLRAAGFAFPDDALARGIASATWPARLQRLDGALARALPPGWELWLDGGHNAGAGLALADVLATWTDRPTHLVVGMKASKDSAGFLAPMMAHAASVWAVAEPGQHLASPVDAIVAASHGRARPGPTVRGALDQLTRGHPPGRVLICGSLYLAGEVLRAEAGLPEAIDH